MTEKHNIVFTPSNIEQLYNGYYTPVCDIKETQEQIIIEIELPGFQSKDIIIEMGDGTIDIRGEYKEDSTQTPSYIRKERLKGKFKKSVPISTNTLTYDIKAILKDGLLTIEIPKPKEKNHSKKQKIALL